MDTRSKASSKSRKELGGKQSYNSNLDELSLKGVSLFKLDVNYDHLKQFLEGVQSDLDNQNAEIEALKKLVGPSEILILMQEQFHLMGESLNFTDKDIEKELSAALHTYMTQISGKQKMGHAGLEKVVHDLRGRLFSVVNLVQSLFRERKRHDARISKLEQDMLTKYDTKEAKEKMRKQKNGLEQQIEEAQKGFRNDIDYVDKKLTTDIQKFEETVRDVERKTLWKIHDCQDLLSKRINEEFVVEAIRASEEKMLKEIAQIDNNEQTLKFQQDIAYLKSQIKGLDENVGDKQQKLKLQLNELNEQLKAKLGIIDKLVEQNKISGDKITDLNSRLATAINKLDVSGQLDQQRQKLKQLDDAINKLNEEARQRVEALKDMNLNAENVAFLLSKIDPHKICCLEGDIKKLEEQSIRNNVHWETLDTEFKSRFDSFQFFSQLYSQQQQQQQQQQQKQDVDYVTKDELNRILMDQQQQGTIEEDKIRKLQKDLQDMGSKVEGASDIERRVTRIFRDLDINSLIKQVKLKANDEEMRKELFILTDRLSQALETIHNLRREIDALQVQMKKTPTGQMSVSPPTDQIIGLNTKKLYPINCLSCSTTNPQRVKGTDGRYYQGDVKRVVQYENQYQDAYEESGIQYQQSQQQQIQRPQSAVVNKSYNAKQRPMSGKR